MLLWILLGVLVGFLAGSVLTFLANLGLVADGREKVMLKAGAFVCSICPLCIYSRSKPESDLAPAIGKIEKVCVFCKAFRRLRRIEREEQEPSLPGGACR
ncbi:MAG: hypothetical protein RDV48_28680 [Candidatus Eremiobacteraeota bacterium]|nr:hypothetical protein [Candidatus Eremiobacteraeota bacterium]